MRTIIKDSQRFVKLLPIDCIDKILNQFRPCFSRFAAFKWFSILVFGLMTRSDLLGTTSVIRGLALNPGCYERMNLFFRAASWKLDSLKLKWFEIVASSGLLHKEHGYTILIGDGVKQPKKGKYMPGVNQEKSRQDLCVIYAPHQRQSCQRQP